MIRQIIRPQRKQVVLDIPSEFVGNQVEIIAFQIEGGTLPEKAVLKPVKKNSLKERHKHLMNFIKMHPIKLPKGYKFNREDLYE
jgi:hypothetical protein